MEALFHLDYDVFSLLQQNHHTNLHFSVDVMWNCASSVNESACIIKTVKNTNTQCFFYYYCNIFLFLLFAFFHPDFTFLCAQVKETSLLEGKEVERKSNVKAHEVMINSGLHMFSNVGLLMNEAERNLWNPPQPIFFIKTQQKNEKIYLFFLLKLRLEKSLWHASRRD